jgi:hypothetical protein
VSIPNAEVTITDVDFPALYRSADRSSLEGQSRYIFLVRLNLFLIILGALPSIYAWSSSTFKFAVAISSAAVLFASGAVTFAVSGLRFEKTWFAGRALAESVKTMSWRYMTRTEPFDCNQAQADERFIKVLRELLDKGDEICGTLGDDEASADQITAKMRSVRALDTGKRKSIYSASRVQDQRNWYANKSKANRKARAKWFQFVILMQVLAGITALIGIGFPDSKWTVVPIFASAASAAFAWMQVKQHQELAQAYALAAHDLGLVQEQLNSVNTEKELSDFVGDAENSISREHTLWAARRDVAPK